METSIKTTAGIADMLEQIQTVCSVSDILRLIKNIDALKVALDAADTFRGQAIKYAKLEASALIRAVELGGLNNLRGLHKKTAEWLYGLSESERDKYILMCDDGLTIDQVFKREVGDAQALNRKIQSIELQRDMLIDECKESGIVDMKQFSCNVRDVFKCENRSIGEDIIDGTRNRLRMAGAVGVGGDTGIYVMPCSGNGDEIRKAILLRYESICNDFRSVREIARASRIKMSYKEFNSGARFAYHNDPYLINVLLSFIDMGLISDAEDCVAEIDKTSFMDDIEYIKKQFGVSREQYIKAQYEKLFPQDGSDGDA